MTMPDDELKVALDAAVQDTTAFDEAFIAENAELLDRFYAKPYGDEKRGRSKVVSNDVADVVGADMPSLARVFLGAGDIIKFAPNKTSDKEDKKEADDKTKYVNWQIRGQDWSYEILLGWIFNAEVQKVAALKYFIEETTEIEEHRKEGLSEFELALVEESLKGEHVKSVDVSEQGEERLDGLFDVTFKVEKARKQVKLHNVPVEKFIMTRNAESKDDAAVVGDIELTTRGELLSRKFDKDLISLIPEYDGGPSVMDAARSDSNRSPGSSQSGWAMQEVEIQDLYVMLDYDEDGIAERRHIIRSSTGDVVLLNESFNHVPYAVMSANIMPHRAIGRSRAEITAPTALNKTAILRAINDNIYAVNKPQTAVNKNVDMDAVLNRRLNGIWQVKGEERPGNSVMTIETPYIGDKSLQVIQYLDQARAQTTGALMASQGLDADALGKETATRFEGVENSGAAKVELVARNMAETGWRDLFVGVAWLDENYQDTETEIEVLGEELKINPSNWRFNHSAVNTVGLGVGDNEKLMQTMTGFLQVHQALKNEGSPLTDQTKVYNILKRIVKGSGLADVSEFFNNPERPQELVQAENELLNNAVKQLQEQVQSMVNPLKEAEEIKAKTKLIEAQGKAKLDIAEMLEDQRQFNAKLQAEMTKERNDMVTKLTELELKYNQNIPGAAV